MNLLRYPFQAFFQPLELEAHVAKNPGNRKRIAWTHAALAAAWFAAWLALTYTVAIRKGVDIFEEALVVLLATLILYGSTVIIGFAAGGLSKRDSLVTFMVSTYWSFVISLIVLLILKLSFLLQGRGSEMLGTALVPLGLIIITNIVVNLHGRTRGFRPAIVLAIAAASVIVFLCLGTRTSVSIRSFQAIEGSDKMIQIDGYYPSFRFSGLFPTSTQQPVFTRLQLNENSSSYNIRAQGHEYLSDDSTRLFRLTGEILTQLKAQHPDLEVEKLRPIVGIALNEVDFFNTVNRLLGTDQFNLGVGDAAAFYARRFGDKYYVDELTQRLKLQFKSEQQREENISGVSLPNNETLSAPVLVDGLYKVARVGSAGEIWSVTLKSKPRFGDPNWRLADNSNIVLKDNLLYLFSDDRPYVLDFTSGRDLTEGMDFSWYPGLFGSMSSATATPRGVLSVSPSGYLVNQTFADGTVNLDRQPLYVQELRDFSEGLVLIFAFYFVGVALVLMIGLYRVPIFIVESIWQTVMVLKFRQRPAASIDDAKKLPLFFDHISTLPLPFSSWLLGRVARRDEHLCGVLLLYLLEKTQQTKLAAREARTVLLRNPTITIEWFYRLLKPERKRVFDLLNKQFRSYRKSEDTGEDQLKRPQFKFLQKSSDYDNRIEKLFDTYQSFISADRKEPLVDDVANALRPFADNQYRYAREVLLTYEVFAKFYQLANVQELADADLALSELQQISAAETLNINLAETWGVVIELANDLKNYDAVESFRDKQYYLSEARIKLYEITRRAQQNVAEPEGPVLIEIVEKWQELIITEAKLLRGPAELQLALSNKKLSTNGEWSNIQITVKNVGQSPAENISISLLENENLIVLENKKQIRLLGTGEVSNLEFTIKPEGNIQELRMYFDASFDDFERKSKAFTFADVLSLTTSVAEFKKIQNPYVVGIPLQSDKVFYGRRKVLNFALENLRAGEQNNVLVFYGQRRIGKSSLLYRIKESPLKNDYLFVYIDCQGFADADTGKVLYRISESIQLAAQDQGLKFEKPNLDKFKENTFIEFDAYLDRCEKLLGTRTLVLMLDEYEYLEYKVKDGSLSAEIFNKLRNLMQHRNKKLTFIFVGTHKLQELTSNYWSFLFNTALYYEIGPLGAPEARALITDPVKGYLRYDELAVDKILRVTGMHPYFIQGTCRALVNYCNRRRKNYVTLTDVNEVLRDAVESSTAHVKYLYQDYANETEQQILTFLARVTDESKLSSTAKEISRFALENGFAFEPGPVQEILSTLKNKRLLRDDGEMHEQFSFEYEFLRIWIKEHIRIRPGALITS